MELDLLIVGGGYWGAGICIEAKKLGWNVLVVDDKDCKSGSRNASAVCDPGAYKSSVFRRYWPCDWGSLELEDSLNWLLDNGGEWKEEWFWNKFAGTPPRSGTKAIYLPDPNTLMRKAQPKVWGKIVSCARTHSGGFEVEVATLPGRVEVQTREGSADSYRTKRLVVAAGYRTDEVLGTLGVSPLGVSSLYGRGMDVVGKLPLGIPCPVSVMIRPYCKHTVREWPGGLYKVGDTAEAGDNLGTPSKMESLHRVAATVFGEAGYTCKRVSEGYRPVLDKHLVEKIEDNLVVATGGHRVGLGLTGLVAKKVLEALR